MLSLGLLADHRDVKRPTGHRARAWHIPIKAIKAACRHGSTNLMTNGPKIT
jgi:hypothetical protein